MSFLYFAYGSNLWPERLGSRCPSAAPVTRASLRGWTVVYDKPGADGTAKMNLRPSAGSVARGVVYEIEDPDRPSLDSSEPGYTPFDAEVVPDIGGVVTALTYAWEPAGIDSPPAGWYLATVLAGARHHGLDPSYVSDHLDVPSTIDDAHR